MQKKRKHYKPNNFFFLEKTLMKHKKKNIIHNNFHLSKSALEEYINLEEISQKKRTYQVHIKDDIGIIGIECYNKMKSTVANHNKQIFRPIRRFHNLSKDHSNMINQDQQQQTMKRMYKNNSYFLSTTIDGHSKSFKTLSLLKQVSQKQDLDKGGQISLQAKKLPILHRRESKRKQSLAAFDFKNDYFSSPSPSPDHKKNSKFSMIKTAYHWREMRPEIRGWDTKDFQY